MVTSYLSPQSVASIEAAMRRMHATKLALAGGGIALVLARWNVATQDHEAIPAQTVVVEYANRAEREQATDAAVAVTVDGWFEKLAPFDVEVGDLFALGDSGDEMRGSIVAVRPENLGTQRAGFRLRLGEM